MINSNIVTALVVTLYVVAQIFRAKVTRRSEGAKSNETN